MARPGLTLEKKQGLQHGKEKNNGLLATSRAGLIYVKRKKGYLETVGLEENPNLDGWI